MASALIRVHGDLLDFVPRSRRGAPLLQRFVATASVKDVIEAVGVPHPEVAFIRVGDDFVGLEHRLSGDTAVEVYPFSRPPDPTPALRAGAWPSEPFRFVLDVHLGKLANGLRMLGFDTVWRNDAEDAWLSSVAATEQRILLTRDVGLLKRAEVRFGYFPRSDEPRVQLEEVVKRFGLDDTRAFTRCLKCNGALASVEKSEIADQLPPHVRATHTEFVRCSDCDQVFWKGSHHAAMSARLPK